MAEHQRISETLADCVRYLLAGLFALVIYSAFTFSDQKAHAANPVAAAPGYLSFTLRSAGNSKFYITDTNRKVICVYSLNGNELRLVSVRRFDQDSSIIDGSIKAPVAVEANGCTRDDAKVFVRNCKAILDEAARKYGQKSIGGE